MIIIITLGTHTASYNCQHLFRLADNCAAKWQWLSNLHKHSHITLHIPLQQPLSSWSSVGHFTRGFSSVSIPHYRIHSRKTKTSH